MLAVAAANPSAAVAAPRQAVQSTAIAGDWAGQFLGSKFTFEFRQAGAKWSGRYRSDKTGKWNNLNNLSVAGGTIRFAFSSQPPIVVSLKGSGANTLAGAANVAGDGSAGASSIPLTLTRSAGAK